MDTGDKNMLNIIKKNKKTFIFLSFLLLSILVRLPTFFTAVINWDESTFILMGQSFLEGYLPYASVWDIKPPLVFVFFGIFALGKNIVLVRLWGALCVAVTAFFIFLIAKVVFNFRTGIIGGMLFTFWISLNTFGQPTMSEHVAAVFLLASIFVIVSSKLSIKSVFLCGVLISIATMIRLNLAYVGVFMGGYIFIKLLIEKRSLKLSFYRSFPYVLGIMSVVFITIFPYLFKNQFNLWWQNVIVAPLSYASSQESFRQILLEHLSNIGESMNLDKVSFSIVLVNAVVWFCYYFGLNAVVSRWKNFSQLTKNHIYFLLLCTVAVVISISNGGAAYAHYLIQLAPLVIIFSAFILGIIFKLIPRTLALLNLIVIISLFLIPVVAGYASIFHRISKGKSLYKGDAFVITDYLKNANPNKEPIFLMDNHLVYWLGDYSLPSKMAHPSNIGKEYLLKDFYNDQTASTYLEMKKILDQKPKFIVRTQPAEYLKGHEDAVILLDNELKNYYVLVKKIADGGIYERNSL